MCILHRSSKKILFDAILSTEGILKEPKPTVNFKGFEDWTANYSINFYVDHHTVKDSCGMEADLDSFEPCWDCAGEKSARNPYLANGKPKNRNRGHITAATKIFSLTDYFTH
jgi:hypothetical protein